MDPKTEAEFLMIEEEGTALTLNRSADGKVIALVISSDIPITMQEFLLEVEQYLTQVSKAAAERIQLGSDH